MFSMHISKANTVLIVIIVILVPLLIIAAIHLLDNKTKSVYDNVLTEEVVTDIL